MPGRCRLPSTIHLAVMILVAYGVFLNLASHRMTNTLESRTANLHYGLPSSLLLHDDQKHQQQQQHQHYRVPKIEKIDGNNNPAAQQPYHHQANNKNGPDGSMSISDRLDLDAAVAAAADDDDDNSKKKEEMLPVSKIKPSIQHQHHLPSKKKKNDGETSEQQTTTIDEIRKEWYNVIQTNPMYQKSLPTRPLRVALVTRDIKSGPTNHVLMDGIQNSNYLELVGTCLILNKHGCSHLSATNRTIDLWIMDANGIKTKAKPNDLVHQLLEIEEPWFQILFIDYSDRLVPKDGFMKNHYPDLEYTQTFQQDHIRFALRCIVRGRIFRFGSMNYVHTGTLLSPTWDNMLSTNQGLPFHAPFAVRTDFINSIQDLIPTMAKASKSNTNSKSTIPYHPADSIDRPYDIVHLWEILLPSKNNDLRNLVTEKVMEMGKTMYHPIEIHRKLNVDTSIQGDRAHKGRWGVSDAYATTLLQAKIVIVTQRDQWEDHFRLFEGLASGAMVLMDEMLSLPHSLQDGESVVFFHNLDEMQDLAIYYLEHTEERLAIARKGWEISMKYHRSWHRLEEMLFGRGVTKTDIRDSWFPNMTIT